MNEYSTMDPEHQLLFMYNLTNQVQHHDFTQQKITKLNTTTVITTFPTKICIH